MKTNLTPYSNDIGGCRLHIPGIGRFGEKHKIDICIQNRVDLCIQNLNGD